MKNKDRVKDVRTWCAGCRIRIAPTEERIERELLQYHIRCRPQPYQDTDKHLPHS